MNSGKYAFCASAALIRASMSATMRSQIAYPTGRITMVPRTGPLSASSALVITSWYQRGKSSARGVSTRAMRRHPTGAGGQCPVAVGPSDSSVISPHVARPCPCRSMALDAALPRAVVIATSADPRLPNARLRQDRNVRGPTAAQRPPPPPRSQRPRTHGCPTPASPAKIATSADPRLSEPASPAKIATSADPRLPNARLPRQDRNVRGPTAVLIAVIATSAEPGLSGAPIHSHQSADVAITQPLVRGRRDLETEAATRPLQPRPGDDLPAE